MGTSKTKQPWRETLSHRNADRHGHFTTKLSLDGTLEHS